VSDSLITGIVMYCICGVGWIVIWSYWLNEFNSSWYRTHRSRKRRTAAVMILLVPVWIVPAVCLGVGALIYWFFRLLAVAFGRDRYADR
jgi:hypothetical protein